MSNLFLSVGTQVAVAQTTMLGNTINVFGKVKKLTRTTVKVEVPIHGFRILSGNATYKVVSFSLKTRQNRAGDMSFTT